jgi:hypothetical protein
VGQVAEIPEKEEVLQDRGAGVLWWRVSCSRHRRREVGPEVHAVGTADAAFTSARVVVADIRMGAHAGIHLGVHCLHCLPVAFVLGLQGGR